MTTPTTNQPTPDAAGEAFESTVKGLIYAVRRSENSALGHEYPEQAIKRIRTAADILAAERVKVAKTEDKLYLTQVKRIIADLAKNSAHAFGVDFQVLNDVGIETSKRIAAIEAKEPTS